MKKDSVNQHTLRPLVAGLFLLGLITLPGCASLKEVAQRASDDKSANPPLAATSTEAAAPSVLLNAPRPTAPAVATAASQADGAKLFSGSGNFVKTAPPAAPVMTPGGESFNLNFEATDIRSLIQYILGDYLKESFTVHPQTTGNATIRTSQPVNKKDLMAILEMLLRQNGQIMVKEEGLYKIMPQALGTRGTVTPQLAGPTLPSGFSVQLIQLKYVGAKDMQRILEPYAIEPQSSVRLDEVRNLVILSGTQRELKHMLDVIDLFDVDFLSGYSIGLFPMQSDVKTLQADLDKLFGAGAQGTSPLAGIVRIIPIERMNGLLVVTTQSRYLEEAKKWIDRLDKGGGLSGGMRLNVYPVQNGKAEKLAQLLSDIYGGNRGATGSSPTLAPGQRPATATTTPTPGATTTTTTAPANPLANAFQSFALSLGGGANSAQSARIIADSDNNALLVLASPSDYDTILAALKQLDVPRRQVLVEVLVAEVTLTDELKFGIEWFINARYDTIGSLRNAGGALPATPQAATVSAQAAGLQLINRLNGDIRSVLQTLGQDGRATVESRPNLLILDNEKGTINVGTQISVSTGTTTTNNTGGTSTSFQYINTGVILTVTPRINAGGRVTLDVSQEVSTAGETPTDGSNPRISTRKAQTVVNVASGETMVLAGLIQRDHGTSSAGVPLISKIPLIGGLFGTQSYKNNRTELVILITPKVVGGTDDARAVTDELRKKLPSLESLIQKEKN